jgi:hypothetical protein
MLCASVLDLSYLFPVVLVQQLVRQNILLATTVGNYHTYFNRLAVGWKVIFAAMIAGNGLFTAFTAMS